MFRVVSRSICSTEQQMVSWVEEEGGKLAATLHVWREKLSTNQIQHRERSVDS